MSVYSIWAAVGSSWTAGMGQIICFSSNESRRSAAFLDSPFGFGGKKTRATITQRFPASGDLGRCRRVLLLIVMFWEGESAVLAAEFFTAEIQSASWLTYPEVVKLDCERSTSANVYSRRCRSDVSDRWRDNSWRSDLHFWHSSRSPWDPEPIRSSALSDVRL